MKILVLVGRLVFGGWFLVHGLNYWTHFFPQPLGHQPLARELMAALIDSGLLALVKAIEVAAGVLILADRLTALALVAALPISVVIAFLNVALEHTMLGLLAGPITIGLNIVLMLAYFDSYRPLLTWRPVT